MTPRLSPRIPSPQDPTPIHVYTCSTSGKLSLSHKSPPSSCHALSAIQIRAADEGEPARSHQARISVQVVETPKESANPPAFRSANQTAEVTESDNVGYLVALMQASDKDGDSLWYDIVGEFKRLLWRSVSSSSYVYTPFLYSLFFFLFFFFSLWVIPL